MNNITKKAYVKPDVALVDFSLSSSIAANCKFDPMHGNATDCKSALDADGTPFFSMEIFTCEIHIDVSGKVDICYDVPTDDARVFAS